MTDKDEFQENTGIVLDSRKGQIDFEAFKAFAEQHGQEQAKGYLKAIKDLHPIIKGIAKGDIIGRAIGLLQGDAYFISPENREMRAKEFFNHLERFLELASSLGFIQDLSAKPDANSKDFSPE